MAQRYFVGEPIRGDRVVLTGSEAHHLARVMRAQAGAEVVLFDGTGVEFPATVQSVGRGEVVLRVGEPLAPERELPVRLTLGVSLPKGDRQRWLVEKAVELGVCEVIPVVTSRSVARPGSAAIQRLQRTVIEASKQCGRNRLMAVGPARAWSEFVSDTQSVNCRLLACQGGALWGQARQWHLRSRRPEQIALAVGPEGGLTETEILQAARAGWDLVDLGPRVLRVETAAIWLVALVTHALTEP